MVAKKIDRRNGRIKVPDTTKLERLYEKLIAEEARQKDEICQRTEANEANSESMSKKK